MSKRSRIETEKEEEHDTLKIYVAHLKKATQIPYTLKQYNGNNVKHTSFKQGADSIIYGVHFQTPLKSHVHEFGLFIAYENTFILKVPLVGDEKVRNMVEYSDWRYWIYETHQLILERSQDMCVLGLFFQLINVDTSFKLDRPHVVPHVNTALYWFNHNLGQDRFIDTQFFPYNLNPEQYGIKLNTETIPQRTPLWKRVRGEVSGTKAYKLIGYYVPTVKEDPQWTWEQGDSKPINAEQKSRMRFGSLHEEEANILLMLTRPHIRVTMVGWCSAPNYLKFPKSWGCSPDGRIFDPLMSHAKIPGYIWNTLTEREQAWDVRHGALEIKSSKNSLKFNPYYLPQVYLEMMCLETVWCDLVRFTKKKVTNEDGKWETKYTARVFRIYRHKPTEDSMVVLWKYALEHKDTLQEIVHTDKAFIEFRQYLQDLVDESLVYEEISSTDEMMPTFESFHEYQVQVRQQVEVVPKKLGFFPLPRSIEKEEVEVEEIKKQRVHLKNDTITNVLKGQSIDTLLNVIQTCVQLIKENQAPSLPFSPP
jgi:hypothetical protein